ncbi:MAG: hypothetical protein ACRDOF_08295 [Gaiellaceae bacterium]
MKKALITFCAAIAGALSLVISGAGANGSPYSPGLAHGWDGVLASDGDVRFVTLGTAASTTVAAISVRGGRVLRTRTVRGSYGVPLVAHDGTTGGLSGDGRLLVVASYGPQPGTAGSTQFLVLATRSLRPRSLVKLAGSWSFDAISPDGKTLYLVEHLSAGPKPRYSVRVFDLARNRLVPGAVVDRIEKESVMGGQPVTRASSPDGRWAYTLYARPTSEPFVHALDTARREAFCIDLPLRMGEVEQWGLRLRLAPEGELAVRNGSGRVAAIDTVTFAVRQI